jgi:hypothetical protein
MVAKSSSFVQQLPGRDQRLTAIDVSTPSRVESFNLTV